LTLEITKIKSLPSDEIEQVLKEYQATAARGVGCAIPGEELAKKMLVNAFGQEPARKMLDHVARLEHMDAEVLDAMEKVDAEQLAHFVQKEHPRTIAVILSQVDRGLAGALLAKFRSEIRFEVVRRMATLEKISPEVLHRIGATLSPAIRALGEFQRKPYGGRRAVAEILSNLEGTLTDEILDSISQTDPGLVEEVRRLMVVFEDLLGVDQGGIKALLAALDRKILTLALKGTSEQLRQHFTGCMSQRGAEMLREDMEALGPVRLKDVEDAQHQVISAARKLQAEGSLSLKPTENDRYVV
jgi:flagellar motor switch protein FliG